MMRINTEKWKEFKISDLFFVTGSTTTPKSKLDLDSSFPYPYVTTAGTNNGVCGYSNKYTEEGNVLTVDSAVLGTTFYQKDNFTASDHVEKLVPKFEITENIALFISSIMNGTARIYGYAYNEKRSQTALKKETLYLPIKSDESPDWEYMDAFMGEIIEKSSYAFEILNSVNKIIKKRKIDLTGWKRFHLYDENLFMIDMGNKFDKAKMTHINPSINFVGRANANNGITTCVDRIKSINPFKAGCMTVSLGGEYLGSCFIQPLDFYTSQNVIVLIPRWNMSFYIKQFISTMVFKESRTYYKAFKDELNRHIKTDFSFLLPSTDDGKPDWRYMENYMKDIYEQAECRVQSLICI